MQKYVHKDNETLRISNLYYGMLKWFYKKGLSYTIPYEKALLIDQRVFGPAEARGLFATDGEIWWMTEAGRQFVESYEGRSAWKSTESRNFSRYIKVRRTIAAIRRKKEMDRAREARSNGSHGNGLHVVGRKAASA